MEDTGEEGSPWRELRMEDVLAGSPECSGSRPRTRAQRRRARSAERLATDALSPSSREPPQTEEGQRGSELGFWFGACFRLDQAWPSICIGRIRTYKERQGPENPPIAT
jgi:hypothetical protein